MALNFNRLFDLGGKTKKTKHIGRLMGLESLCEVAWLIVDC